jgi:hypothetical protein
MAAFWALSLAVTLSAYLKITMLEPSFAKNSFNEVMRITKGVNKKDSTYWENSRPIPLTDEEITDYKKKETYGCQARIETIP